MEFKHGTVQWPFLYFRALLLNPEYEIYSIEKELDRDQRVITEMETKYSKVEEIFKFWTCVAFCKDPNKSHQTYDEWFDTWFAINKDKLMVFWFDSFVPVNAGETIDPRVGKVYFTIPENIDILGFQEKFMPIFLKLYQKMDRLANQYLPMDLNNARIESNYRLASTERRLDAYEWVYLNELTPSDCIVKAATSNKKCWAKIIHAVKKIVGNDRLSTIDAEDDDLQTSDLDEVKNEIRIAANEGDQLVKNVVLGIFPNCESQDSPAT